MKNYVVYKHTSPNGKVYIGITSQNTKDRWLNGKGYNRQLLFYRAIQKYGWDNFTHEILFENLSKEEACQKEIELIAKYQSNNPEFGYNLCAGGEGANGYTHTEEAKRLIGLASKGNKYSLGVHRTDEFKQKVSEFHKGKKPTLETIDKWKESRKGYKHNEETKQKISNSLKGNKNRLGKSHNEETKQQISKHSKGKIVSEETRKKLSAAAKKQWQKYYELIGECKNEI